MQLAVTPPVVDQCPPGLISIQGRCVQVAFPQFDPGSLFGGGRRPPTPPTPANPRTNVGGGTDGQPPKVGGPAPTPLPQGGGVGAPIPSGSSSGVLKSGGLNPAQALRCRPPQSLNREGRCVCENGMLGANCDQSRPIR